MTDLRMRHGQTPGETNAVPATAFATTLRRYRDAARLSQSKLAERAGFDHSYLSRLEGGARMPTREAVDRLGEAMRLDRNGVDAMLASAGFLPKDVSSLLSSEPVVGEVLDLLQDDGVPLALRDNVRSMLRIMTAQVRIACAGRSA